MQNNEFVYCKCGCNELIPKINKLGRISKFKHGHNMRLLKGKKHHSFKGKVFKSKHLGYYFIYKPDHHFAVKNYVLLHRYVFEYYHKCSLLPWIDIHHINGVKHDNHKSNLIAITRSKHITLHKKGIKGKKKDISNRICLLCGSRNTYYDKNKDCYNWIKYKNGYSCNKCYMKIYNKLS